MSKPTWRLDCRSYPGADTVLSSFSIAIDSGLWGSAGGSLPGPEDAVDRARECREGRRPVAVEMVRASPSPNVLLLALIEANLPGSSSAARPSPSTSCISEGSKTACRVKGHKRQYYLNRANMSEDERGQWRLVALDVVHE